MGIAEKIVNGEDQNKLMVYINRFIFNILDKIRVLYLHYSVYFYFQAEDGIRD